MGVMNTGSFTEATRPSVPGNLLALMIGKARETTQEQGNIRSRVFNDTLAQHMGTTWNSPKIGSLAMQGLNATEEITNYQILTTSNVVITPGEAGMAVKFAKKSLAQWTEPMASRAGRIMRDGKDRKIDADLGGLAPSLTTYTLGGAATVLTSGLLAAGKSRLKGGNNTAASAIAAGTVSNQAPAGPIDGFFRWESLTQVMRILGGSPMTDSFATSMGSTGAIGPSGTKQAQVLDNLYVDKVAGVNLFGNSNLAKDASDDTVGMIIHGDAIAYVPFPHDGANGGVLPKDSDDGRFTQFTLVVDYGFGILDQNYGIAVTCDATAPTA